MAGFDGLLLRHETLFQSRTPHPGPLPLEGERENRSRSKKYLRLWIYPAPRKHFAIAESRIKTVNLRCARRCSLSSGGGEGWVEEAVFRAESWAGAKETAFTLIELMVVIALIGILSAMIIPEMRGTYEEALLRSTSRQLVNLCNLAYSRAVSMQQVHRVVLDPITGKFVLEKRDHRATHGKIFVPAEHVSGSEGELDNRISIRFHRRTEDVPDRGGAETVVPAVSDSSGLSGQVVIGFYPDGTADPGEIQLRDRYGFGLLLRISPVTSRVRVIELPRE